MPILNLMVALSCGLLEFQRWQQFHYEWSLT